jgi:hypothetical protein
MTEDDRGKCGCKSQSVQKLARKRSRDINLWFLVGEQGECKFTIFKEPLLSTKSVEREQELRLSGQEIDSEIEVPTITLFELLNTYFPEGNLTVLLIDAEASDLEVLQSARFEDLPNALFPEWIVI